MSENDESEPLFSAETGNTDRITRKLNGSAGGRVYDHDIDNDEADAPSRLDVLQDGEQATSPTTFPPPRYLKSTIKSREHEYDADSDKLDDDDAEALARELEGSDLQDAASPRFHGLLANAHNRGSIDAGRASENGHAQSIDDEDDVALQVGRQGEGSVAAAISNMANAILGAGIIGLPYAAREAGFITGVLLLVTLGYITDWTLRLVVLNAKLTGKRTYVDIMEACFGTYGRAAVSFFQFSFAFGGMCAFAVILGDTIPHVITSLLPGFAATTIGSYIFSRQVVVVLTTLGISYPLSLYRDIEKLSKASALALVSMAIIVLTVVIDGPKLDADLKGSRDAQFTIISGGFFEAVGVISFAYVCHHNSLLIFGSLRTPTLDRWNRVTHISTGLSVVASLIMTVAGYSIFTDKTRGNILNNFPVNSFWANLARLCFGLNMMTTTPLECFVCREVFENFFYPGQPFNQQRHVIVTSVIVFSAMLISLMTCDLGLVLEVTGGFGATCLAYIFPAACSIKLSSDPYGRQRWPAWTCAAFGTVVMVLATSLAIVKSGSKPHKVC